MFRNHSQPFHSINIGHVLIQILENCLYVVLLASENPFQTFVHFFQCILSKKKNYISSCFLELKFNDKIQPPMCVQNDLLQTSMILKIIFLQPHMQSVKTGYLYRDFSLTELIVRFTMSKNTVSFKVYGD